MVTTTTLSAPGAGRRAAIRARASASVRGGRARIHVARPAAPARRARETAAAAALPRRPGAGDPVAEVAGTVPGVFLRFLRAISGRRYPLASRPVKSRPYEQESPDESNGPVDLQPIPVCSDRFPGVRTRCCTENTWPRRSHRQLRRSPCVPWSRETLGRRPLDPRDGPRQEG